MIARPLSPVMTRLARCFSGLLVCAAPVAWAEGVDGAVLSPALGQQVSQMLREGAQQVSTTPVRAEVEVGQLDPRLQLAPCARIEPYLPVHAPAWGRTRVGLRCVEGPKRWNVSLPVTVRLWAQALVAQQTLPAGTVLAAQHLRLAEVDLAAAPGAALREPVQALGRTLQRSLSAGETLRQPDLKVRQWFSAGDRVRVIASGAGWRVVTEGQAMTAGFEGQPVRVQVESGRMLQGRAVADREVELLL